MSITIDKPPSWGQHLKQLRGRRGWTQRDLEARSGVSRSRISQIERGIGSSPGLDILLGLQRAFRLDSLEALLGIPPSAGLSRVDVGEPRGQTDEGGKTR